MEVDEKGAGMVAEGSRPCAGRGGGEVLELDVRHCMAG